MASLLPIITNSIIGKNGFFISYYWPGQLGDVLPWYPQPKFEFGHGFVIQVSFASLLTWSRTWMHRILLVSDGSGGMAGQSCHYCHQAKSHPHGHFISCCQTPSHSLRLTCGSESLKSLSLYLEGWDLPYNIVFCYIT